MVRRKIARRYMDFMRIAWGAKAHLRLQVSETQRKFMTGFVEEKSPRIGEAGHSGKDVRSDLHVAIEPRDAGGLEITMESRVAPYYGSSILVQALHGPDAIILDLEDSVHHAEKDAARILVRNALRAVDFGQCERMVRINHLPMGLEDLAEIIPENPDLILLPKAELPEHVAETDRMIGELKSRYGITRPIWLIPILESALGIENASSIAMASKNVVAISIGLE